MGAYYEVAREIITGLQLSLFYFICSEIRFAPSELKCLACTLFYQGSTRSTPTFFLAAKDATPLPLSLNRDALCVQSVNVQALLASGRL